MRKGLVSFIIILCMLIPLAVGCNSNPADANAPAQMQNQSTPPESNPLPTNLSETEPSTQKTEPGVTEAPTKPPRETAPPVTEEPEKTDPQPTQSKPTELTPTTPAQTDPEPTKPPVTEPPATESAATEPAEILDLNALMQYGRNYATSVHGYEACPGLRDGYYPAYTCVFDTMEAGKAAIRGCIDDTTRALLARPGGAIFTEIDGVIYRARIDVVVVPKDEGTYLVSVFYG